VQHAVRQIDESGVGAVRRLPSV